MSDNWQTLALDSVAADDAERVIEAALDWMKASGFIQTKLEDCAYGSDGLGYRPGPNWVWVADNIRTWGDLWRSWSRIWRHEAKPDYPGAPLDSDICDTSDFLRRFPNGVQARTGRCVCDPGAYYDDFRTGVCPACGGEVDPEVDFSELANAWYHGEQVGVLCPLCSKVSRLEDWDFQPYWAFAQAGLTFWNWPPISEQFKAGLLSTLSLPRVRHILGHL